MVCRQAAQQHGLWLQVSAIESGTGWPKGKEFNIDLDVSNGWKVSHYGDQIGGLLGSTKHFIMEVSNKGMVGTNDEQKLVEIDGLGTPLRPIHILKHHPNLRNNYGRKPTRQEGIRMKP